MSLSNSDVQKALTNRFVLATIDTEGDPESGASFSHAPEDEPADLSRGLGEHNVQILFLTPQGEMFHVLSGYVPPKDLVQEIEFAAKAYKAMQAPRLDRALLLRTMHRTAARAARRRPDAPAFIGEFRLPPEAERLIKDSILFDRAVHDHLFAANHPLLPADDFRPSMMFGHGSSFFGAHSGGTRPPLVGKAPGGALPFPSTR